MRGSLNSGACVPKTSLINITYGKERKGRKLAELSENVGKCFLSGKDDVQLKKKIMVALKKPASEAATFTEAPLASLARKRNEQSVAGLFRIHSYTMCSGVAFSGQVFLLF
ncbi:unnamed protein product [Strongylus vulgaris]|uniref:Uncharacterized protein n=1 Tax=Strongylus vulgaris TaxID=40348 RepID=A0A3P7KGJ8_STRVU|nr:unnamed protein product [Strongylus vulgaris]